MKSFIKSVSCALAVSCTSVVFPVLGKAQPVKLPFDTVTGKSMVTVVPGSEYRASALHTLIFGTHWRSLWTTPIEIPVLDLGSFAGGLKPIEKGGGFQTIRLSFRGADGKQYRFRTLDKDPARGMPPKLRNTVVSDVVQDQVSTSNPVSGLVIPPLLDAADVYHVIPKIFVMPYDQRLLGEYYNEFAGLVGTLEEYPEAGDAAGHGFMDADVISGTNKMFNSLEEDSANKVDARAYLRARLIDLFIGDWDRHSEQWRWAGYRRDGLTTWIPIPRDRDNAFSRQDGIFSWIIKQVIPQVEGFGPAFPDIKYLSWSGRPLDRRLFSGIGRTEWDDVTRELKAKLTDEVIHNAVSRMPRAMYEIEGKKLESDLRSRRDLLGDASHELYTLYAEDVDIFASDKAEIAEVHRLENGQVDVSLSRQDVSPASAQRLQVFRRVFSPQETSEVRLYLRGGDDSVTVDGPVSGNGIKVRVVGGGGADRFEDRSSKPVSGADRVGKKTYFYDKGEHSQFTVTKYTVVDRRKVKPEPLNDRERYDFSPRDSGKEVVANVTGLRPDYSSDYGPYLGWGVTVEDYGFREEPYRYSMKFSGGVAPFTDFRYQMQFRGDFRTLVRNASLLIETGTSGMNNINFYGLGNERYYRGSGLTEENFEIPNQITTIKASLRYPMDRNYHWSAGIAGKWVDLQIESGSFIANHPGEAPGIDDDFAGSFHVGFHYDSRKSGEFIELSPRKQQGRLVGGESRGNTAALSGMLVDLEVAHYPEFIGNENSFTKLRGEVRKYIPFSSTGYSRVVLRAGGEKIWGDYPFWEAAYLGGSTSLRGYDRERFAGDASIYAGSELRLYAGNFKFIVPVIFGPVAFLETGRVFVKGEDSSAWHTSVGGGLWFGFVESRYSASIVYGHGFDDGRLIDSSGIYVRAGFSF
ncbi:MAG: BamA/TamA family outer membrane protein [Chlorobiaceae bacterium]|nr:BamA/TamA family outer membrane protein [Chlorobiaceae bacterium]